MKNTVIPILFALLAPILPLVLVLSSQAWFGKISDLPEYYAASRMMLEGQGALIYKLDNLGAVQHMLYPSMAERIVGLYIPPIALPWLLPLGWLEPAIAPIVWMLVQIVAVAASLLILRKIFALSSKAVLWLWAVLSISGPLYESLRIGQLAPLLLLGFSLAIMALKNNRPFLGSLALSALLLKPQELAPFLVYLVGARRYKVISYLIVLTVGLCGASLLLIGVDGYKNYLDLLSSSVANTLWMQSELSATVRGQLLRFFPEQKVLVTQISSVILVGVLALIFCLGRRESCKVRWLEVGLATAFPLGLITSLHCHDYDLLLLAPSIVALVKGGLVKNPHPWLACVGLAGTTLFLLPLYVVIHYQYLLQGGLINPLFWLLVCGTVLVLVYLWRN
ncbi:MAG: DUF2029 domain-containing protein [Candidatus Melainabacteria bacterium]|nr:DUF2029 domain-containing protein [Candidatus Melainabacteria bacterium]